MGEIHRISDHLGVVSRDGVTEFDEEFRMAECNTQMHPKSDTEELCRTTNTP
jgi:hypothetical protein